jgi:hypothetical protein
VGNVLSRASRGASKTGVAGAAYARPADGVLFAGGIAARTTRFASSTPVAVLSSASEFTEPHLSLNQDAAAVSAVSARPTPAGLADTVDPPSPRGGSSLPLVPRPGALAIAKFDFAPSGPDELLLNRGQLVELVEPSEDSGWWNALYVKGRDGEFFFISASGSVETVRPSAISETVAHERGLLPVNRVAVLSDAEESRLRRALRLDMDTTSVQPV